MANNVTEVFRVAVFVKFSIRDFCKFCLFSRLSRCGLLPFDAIKLGASPWFCVSPNG